MVIAVGTLCFFRLPEGSTSVLAEGYVVDTASVHTVLAVSLDLATRFGGLTFSDFGILRVPTQALGTTKPAKWRAEMPAPGLPFTSMLRTYMRSDETVEETSAESVGPTGGPSATTGTAPVASSELAGDATVRAAMTRMFGGARRPSSEEDEDTVKERPMMLTLPMGTSENMSIRPMGRK